MFTLNILIIDYYTPSEGYVAMVRPWYKAALESSPNISRGIPFTEAKTKSGLFH
ncbi:MAG: hypothetical protein H5U37_07880 [Caldisericia bacterium]|nr:hypothetical protein [Caldisericia bacterium]